MSVIPEKIVKLAQTVADAGGRAYLAGGCVRDRLLGRVPQDWDVEVYGIEPTQLKPLLQQLGRVDTVGEAFTIYKLADDVDVSLPRRERKTARGHKGFAIEGDPHMSFADAARRRDFTVNAMLEDALSLQIIDPFGGRADLEAKLLRAVAADTFVEDSLRVLRAAQLAARLGFEIHAETVSLCKAIDLSDLPTERVWGELEKLLLVAEKPSIGLRWLYELGVAAKLFPELQALVGVKQEYDWHPEGDVDVHTMLVVDRARELIDDLPYAKQVTVMLGALCHDLGKPATTVEMDGRLRSLGHDEAGVGPTEALLDRLNIHTIGGYDVRAQVVQLVRYHLKPGEFFKKKEQVGDGAFRRLAQKVEPDLLYRVAKADSLGRNADWVPVEKRFGCEAQDWFRTRVLELDVVSAAPKPLLQGRHILELGVPPSELVGRITKAVYELQLDGSVTNLDQAITAAKQTLQALRS